MRVLKKKGCYENYLTRRKGEFFYAFANEVEK